MTKVAVAVAVALSGCSFAMVDAAPRPVTAGSQFTCTESMGTPLIDALVGMGLAALGIAIIADEPAAVDEPETESERSLRLTVGVGGVVTAAAFGAGALWGITRVRDCRSAQFVARVPVKPATLIAAPSPPPLPADVDCDPTRQLPDAARYSIDPKIYDHAAGVKAADMIRRHCFDRSRLEIWRAVDQVGVALSDDSQSVLFSVRHCDPATSRWTEFALYKAVMPDGYIAAYDDYSRSICGD